MPGNTFGQAFSFATWGESHGPAIGCVVDGMPPGIALAEADIQVWLDKRRPGQSRFTTQRREADEVRILSGVFEGTTTGTPISLLIDNQDQRTIAATAPCTAPCSAPPRQRSREFAAHRTDRSIA